MRSPAAIRGSVQKSDQTVERPVPSDTIGGCAEPGVGAIPAQRRTAQALSARMRAELAAVPTQIRPDITSLFHARGLRPVAWRPPISAPREPQISDATLFVAGA